MQESLTNVLRHAGPAPRARVDVERAADAVTVTVTDTGAAPAAPKPGGHGLPGMRERVEAYGGTFEARATGTGWRVRARLPSTTPTASEHARRRRGEPRNRRPIPGGRRTGG